MTLLKDLTKLACLTLTFFILTEEIAFSASIPSAVYTTEQDLGILTQGLTFQNTHTNIEFTDVYNLTVEPNKGIGVAAISVRLDNPLGAYTTFTSGTLSNILTDATYKLELFADKTSSVFYLVQDYLSPGKYELLINGTVSNGTSSYTGNFTVLESDKIAQTPLPAGIYLFLSGFLALSLLQRKPS